MYEIETGVQIIRAKNAKGSKYPFNKMKVGDSFFAKNVKQSVISSAVNSFKRYHESQGFIVRSVEGGVRCWRIK